MTTLAAVVPKVCMQLSQFKKIIISATGKISTTIQFWSFAPWSKDCYLSMHYQYQQFSKQPMILTMLHLSPQSAYLQNLNCVTLSHLGLRLTELIRYFFYTDICLFCSRPFSITSLVSHMTFYISDYY